MAQRDRIGAYQDLLYDQPQNLLAHGNIQRFGSYPQLASKAPETFRQLEVFRFIDRRHLQRL
jgi:hypothetical protein